MELLYKGVLTMRILIIGDILFFTGTVNELPEPIWKIMAEKNLIQWPVLSINQKDDCFIVDIDESSVMHLKTNEQFKFMEIYK